jgi:hypothetical protein
MGSQHSSENGNNKLSSGVSKKHHENNNQFSGNVSGSNQDLSGSISYIGIKTENNTTKEQSKSGSSLSQKNENEIDNNNTNNNNSNELKIPTFFEWKEGGNNVIITGSFSGWGHRFAMNKNEKTNNFELLLYLPKGIYQFKFIVDNVWRCSKYYKTETDKGNNTNNILDNSLQLNEKIKVQTKEKVNHEKNNNTEKKSNEHKHSNNHKNLMNIEAIKKYYGNIYPDKNQLNNNAPSVPQAYSYRMNLNFNTNQNKFGNPKQLNVNDNNNYFNIDYKDITISSHVYLNHLFSSCDNKNLIKNNNQKFISITTTIRVRSKLTTLTYIHPLQK